MMASLILKAWESLKWRVTNDHEKIFEAILRAAQHCCGSQGVALRVARALWCEDDNLRID